MNRITKNGSLVLDRAGVEKTQICPFDNPTEVSYGKCNCGDWCPLFGESKDLTGSYVELKICNRSFLFLKVEFIDERVTVSS